MTTSSVIRLTKEQKDEGYWTESSGDYVLVWHNNNQVALLRSTMDIQSKVIDVVERRRKGLRKIMEQTGWKP